MKSSSPQFHHNSLAHASAAQDGSEKQDPPLMRRAAFIFNPFSGRRLRQRDADLYAARKVFENAGIETAILPTLGGVHGGEQAASLVAEGYDTLIACGGDGTVHEVLQGIVNSGGRAKLGIIPLGCGNLLAKELGIPLRPQAAARALLRSVPRQVPVGVLETATRGESRRVYWTVAAGVGADARVICALNSRLKAWFGIWAYYAESTRQLLFGEALQPFVVEFRGDSGWRHEVVTQVVAQRVTYFGRHMGGLSRRAGLRSQWLELILFKTQKRTTYLRYGSSLLRNGRESHERGKSLPPLSIPGIEVVSCSELICRSLEGREDAEVLAEVDGELAGRLPSKLFLTSETIPLLHPIAT